jgi:hypothetical protein
VLNFSDPNLEASVRSAVVRETGPLFEQHVQSLNFLDASGRSIALLGGIEKLSAAIAQPDEYCELEFVE